MAEQRFHFACRGLDANQEIWGITGTVESEWADSFIKINKKIFQELTQGKAIYEQPGKGCKGPYSIITLMITREKQS